eukprot:9248486-Ditylum_brightwellii.AAC.1
MSCAVAMSCPTTNRDGRFSEPVARFWFRQLINVRPKCQRLLMDLCHLSAFFGWPLYNLLTIILRPCVFFVTGTVPLTKNGHLGMCLRVPFGDDDGNIMDVSGGTLRRLMSPQGQCGKPNYISPEVLQNTESFDGFAIDVWAAGIILFIMLVGLPPFEWANREDPRFRMITKGGLMRMLTQWQRPISPEAGDLLQRMLKEDPKDRLSLVEIMDHQWVVNEEVSSPAPPQDEDWRS